METHPTITISLGTAEALEEVAHLPKSPGVYAFRAGDDIVHLSWSPNLSTRIVRLLSRANAGNSTLGTRMEHAGFVLDCWPTGSKLESSLLMYRVLRARRPADYRKRLRLRLPFFVTLTTRDSYPRLAVVNRIPNAGEPVFGPFRFRDAAQRYADDVVGCFRIRRCVEPFVPDPSHPGCIYGEIKQCLRPCQKAVDETEYAQEVEGVRQFLYNDGNSQLRALIMARDEATNTLQFEEAADLHRKIGKLREIGRQREDLVCEAKSLSGIALTEGIVDRVFRFWPMVNGLWQQAAEIKVEDDATLESLAGRLQNLLPAYLAENRSLEGEREEHMAILLRWYHSSSRDGRWYPLRAGGKPGFRRIGAAVLQMLKSKVSLQLKSD